MMRTAPRLAGILAVAGAAVLCRPGTALPPSVPTLPTPPFAAFPARGVKSKTPVRLVKVSERRNQVTDEEAWLSRNGLKLPELAVGDRRHASGELPDAVETTFEGQSLLRAVESPAAIQLLYGPDGAGSRYVVGFDKRSGEEVYGLDFRKYFHAPGTSGEGIEQRVQWAEHRNGVLYVSNYHRTYARSSGRKNAYLTALDPRTGRLKWRSRPLVCNTRNFLIHGGAIITGYGFTAEPDFLYVVDRGSGAVVQTVPVKSGPEWIIEKGRRLYVRTYDTDYVFRIKG